MSRLTMGALAKSLGVSRATLYRQGVKGVSRASDETIFAAVRSVMGQRGLRGTTLEAVAEQARVSVVTLHRRFGDRLGLLRAFMDAVPARRAGRELATADVRDVRAVLTAFTRLALEEFEGSSALTRAMLGDPAAAAELASRGRDPARGVSAGVTAYFTRCVQAGSLRGDPGALAAFFLSALFGYGLMIGTFRPGPLATDEAVALLVNGFLDAPAVRSAT